MIITQNESGNVITSGDVKSKTFSMKVTGKAFRMMFDSLYTDKHGSIVRELSCNALDSHRSAGKADVPFDIHLPSVYEPTFYVQDYGIGMSKDTVENIYATFFESTKDNSNDNVGGFGLGGKSPLSYASSFTITAVHEGKKCLFVAVLNETDEPTLNCLLEEDTDECNGVKVELNIEEADHRRFCTEVIKQLRFFKTKPNLLNNAYGYSFEEIEYKAEYGNFKIPTNLRGTWIVQGDVGYPLDRRQFDSRIDDRDSLQFFDLYSDGVMFFDIGQIEVIPSREQVAYSKHTVATLEKFVADIAPIMYKEMTDKIANLDNDWDRLAFLNEDTSMRKFARLAKLSFGVDGNTGDMALKIGGNDNGYNQPYYIELDNIMFDDKGAQLFYMSTFSSDYMKRNYYHRSATLVPRNGMEFLIRDRAKSAIGRFRSYAYHSPQYYDRMFMIEHVGGADKVDDAWVEKLKSYFPGAKFTMASELDEPQKEFAAKRGTPIVYRHPQDKRNFVGNSIHSWEKVYDEEEIEAGYYFEFDVWPNIQFNNRGIVDIISSLYKAKLFDLPIFAVKSTKASLLADNPNFKKLEDAAKEIYEEQKRAILKSPVKLERYKKASVVFHNMNNIISDNMMSLMKTVSVDRAKPEFFLNRATRLRAVSEKYIERVKKEIHTNGNSVTQHLFEEAFRLTSDDYTSVESSIPMPKREEVEALTVKYPLIKFVNTGGYYLADEEKAARANLIFDYIDMVDNNSNPVVE